MDNYSHITAGSESPDTKYGKKKTSCESLNGSVHEDEQ